MPATSDRTAVLRDLAVSRETSERLDAYVALLRSWQRIKNLVAPSTLDEIWSRHILDSAQLLRHLDGRTQIADLGSGAGLPGMILAILLADDEAAHVHLVESNSRKAAFLREAVRVTAAPAIVHAMRIENFTSAPPPKLDMVTARALAPLSKLLDLAEPLLQNGCRALFPKGRDVGVELTEAAESWHMDYKLLPSVTDDSARIVRLDSAIRRG